VRGGSGGAHPSTTSSILTAVVGAAAAAVGLPQQLAPLPVDVLIGIRGCCGGGAVGTFHILLLLGKAAVAAATAVATAQPDDKNEKDEEDAADAGGDAHENFGGEKVGGDRHVGVWDRGGGGGGVNGWHCGGGQGGGHRLRTEHRTQNKKITNKICTGQ